MSAITFDVEAVNLTTVQWHPISTAPKVYTPPLSQYNHHSPTLLLWCGPILKTVRGHWDGSAWWYSCHSGRIQGEPTHWAYDIAPPS